MNQISEQEKIIFLPYQQELNWKKKWLEHKISLIKKKLLLANLTIEDKQEQFDDESNQFECCSRTRAPPNKPRQSIILYPIYQHFSNPSKLINCSFAPITPIWKIDNQEPIFPILKESDLGPDFKDIESNETKNEFSSKANSPSHQNGQNDSISQSQCIVNNTKDQFPAVPKFVPIKKSYNALIPVPQWTLCNHLSHFSEENPPTNIELDSVESLRQKCHIEIEIIQRRIRNNQLNIPIEQVLSHNIDELKIILSNKEKKLEQKYNSKPAIRQVPPNWEQRSYDSPDDLLSEKEIQYWEELMKNELSKEKIDYDVFKQGFSFKNIHVRSSNEFPFADDRMLDDA